MSRSLPDALGSKLKSFAYLPLCLAIAACGGGGGGSDTPPDTGTPPAPSNSAPAAGDDTVSTDNLATDVVIDVLANDSDSDGDPLTIVSVSQSAQGIAPVIEDGKIRYPLNSGVYGVDSFTYTISDGEEESQATVTINIDYLLTISGVIGEQVSGNGSVSIKVGTETQQAQLDGNRYSLQIRNGDDDAVVSVTSSHQNTAIGKGIVLKAYAGTLGDLRDKAQAGEVDESDVPSLYLSALGTSATAYLEMAAGGEVSSKDALVNAAQTLPQALIVEGAVALKSVLAGDNWSAFTQADTYSLLTAHPTAVSIAEQLESENPDGYLLHRNAVTGNQQQFSAQRFQSGQELYFVGVDFDGGGPGGFAIQLPAEGETTGYFADSNTQVGGDNQVELSVTESDISYEIETAESTAFYDGREACTNNTGSVYSATPTHTLLTKYLDTPVYSAYKRETEYRCDDTAATFTGTPVFYQVNKAGYGDFSSIIQGTFAISSYREKDPTIFQGPFLWQATLVSPNSNGSITQRFDFNSGFSDNGAMELTDSGRLKLGMNRGVNLEHIAIGTEGDVIKAFILVRRADGSLAGAAGSYMVPVTPGINLPLPATLASAHPLFPVHDASSKYHAGGFGFEFLADGTGYQLYRPDNTYQRTATGFQWSEASGFIDMRYFHDRTDSSDPYPTQCSEGDMDCVEHRFREFEPLAQVGGDYFIRIYQEIDYSKQYGTGEGEEVWISSYIDRYTVEP